MKFRLTGIGFHVFFAIGLSALLLSHSPASHANRLRDHREVIRLVVVVVRDLGEVAHRVLADREAGIASFSRSSIKTRMAGSTPRSERKPASRSGQTRAVDSGADLDSVGAGVSRASPDPESLPIRSKRALRHLCTTPKCFARSLSSLKTKTGKKSWPTSRALMSTCPPRSSWRENVP